MTVRVYRWDDASAPVVDNAASDILDLLDACLVAGYGAKAASGWGKPFTGSNKAVFRAPSGNRHYLRVVNSDDTTALLTGYETMSDVDTGTGPFPTVAQGTHVRTQCDYSYITTARGVSRPWVLVATDRMFHLYLSIDNIGPPNVSYQAGITSFGEFVTYKPGDAYHTLLAAHGTTDTFAEGWYLNASLGASTGGIVVARTHLQTGTSMPVTRFSDYTLSQSGTYGAGGLPYPNPSDGGLYLAPVFLGDNGSVRGVIPGIWNPCHNKPLENFDTFTGTGALAGKTFLALNGPSGQVCFEISDTW
jgi:hypothetical protein